MGQRRFLFDPLGLGQRFQKAKSESDDGCVQMPQIPAPSPSGTIDNRSGGSKTAEAPFAATLFGRNLPKSGSKADRCFLGIWLGSAGGKPYLSDQHMSALSAVSYGKVSGQMGGELATEPRGTLARLSGKQQETNIGFGGSVESSAWELSSLRSGYKAVAPQTAIGYSVVQCTFHGRGRPGSRITVQVRYSVMVMEKTPLKV